MKMPISWHEENLIRMWASYAREAEQLKIKEAHVERIKASCIFKADQVIEAKRRKLDGFDEDRFMKNRK